MPVFRWLCAGDMVKLRVADSSFRVVSDPGMWQGNIAGPRTQSLQNTNYTEIDNLSGEGK